MGQAYVEFLERRIEELTGMLAQAAPIIEETDIDGSDPDDRPDVNDDSSWLYYDGDDGAGEDDDGGEIVIEFLGNPDPEEVNLIGLILGEILRGVMIPDELLGFREEPSVEEIIAVADQADAGVAARLEEPSDRAAFEAMFDARVLEALSSSRPTITHEQAMHNLRAHINGADLDDEDGDGDGDDLVLQLALEIANEVHRARAIHAPMHSPHEGISVIREEFEELWDHVKADTGTSDDARKEAVQLGAMAIRYVVDLIENPQG